MSERKINGIYTVVKELLCGCSETKTCADHGKMKTMWTFSEHHPVPYRVSMRQEFYETADLKDTEKAALDSARKLAKANEERWYQVIRAIDHRIDAIETAEVEAENDAARQLQEG